MTPDFRPGMLSTWNENSATPSLCRRMIRPLTGRTHPGSSGARSITFQCLLEPRRQSEDDPLRQAPDDALLMGKVAETPGSPRFEPGTVVQQPLQRDGEHALQLTLVVDKRPDRVREVGQERHDREIAHGGVDRIPRT